jgi:cytochrome c oxidase cbb3-type subunit IV
MMNPSSIQSAITVVMFVLFLGIVVWAWSGKRKRAFDAAAQLPFGRDTKPENKEGPL